MGDNKINDAKQRLRGYGVPETVLSHEKLNQIENNPIWVLAAEKLENQKDPSLIPKTLVNFLAAFATLNTIVFVLFSRQQDYDKLVLFASLPDDDGRPPLFWALSYSNTSLVYGLKLYNININVNDLPEVKKVLQAIKGENYNAMAAALNSMPAWLLDGVITLEPQFNRNVLGEAARLLSSDDFKSLIAKCSEDKLNKALVKQSYNKWTPLHIAVRYQDAAGLSALLQKCSEDALNDALVKQNKDGWTALHIAVRSQDAAGLTALLQKCSEGAVNDALVKKTDKNWTVLHLAAFNQDAAVISMIVERCSPDALAQALLVRNRDNKTPLDYIRDKQSETILYQVLSKALRSDKHKVEVEKLIGTDLPEVKKVLEAIKDEDFEAMAAALNSMPTWLVDCVITLKSQFNRNVLGAAARHLSADDFKSLVEKCSNDKLNIALVHLSDWKWTALHTAARYQNAAGLTALLKKCSEGAVNDALVKQNKDGWTALHHAARYQNAAGLTALLQKCSKGAVNDALVKKTDKNSTVLHLAAFNQDAAVISMIVERYSPDALVKALLMRDMDNKTPLDYMSKNQSETVLYQVLSKALSSDANQGDIIALITYDANIRLKFVTQMIASKQHDMRYDLSDAESKIVNAGIGLIPSYNPAKTAWEAYKANRAGISSATRFPTSLFHNFRAAQNTPIGEAVEMVSLIVGPPKQD